MSTPATAHPAGIGSGNLRPDLAELAHAAGQGDLVATAGLIRATSPTIWRACAALVDRASADDLTQDTYLRAIRSLSGYRGEADPRRWLLTIARRVCAEEISRRQRERAVHSRLRTQPVRHTPGPAGEVELLDALNSLDRDRREALVLTGVLGLTYAEAALICDCAVGTIRSRVARGRHDLATTLTAAGDPVQHRSGQ